MALHRLAELDETIRQLTYLLFHKPIDATLIDLRY
jgi:hypothetical protein